MKYELSKMPQSATVPKLVSVFLCETPAGMTVALRALISYHVTANFSGLLDSNFISIENFCSGHNTVPPKVWIALQTVVIHYTQATE